MPFRRLVRDDCARVPFAMVAVLILMLSVFSMSYLSGIQRQEGAARLVGAEVSRQQTLIHEVEDRMALEGYYIAAKSVAASTQFLCNQTLLDTSFQENYTLYLEEVFPVYKDPYLVDVRDFRASVFLEERNLQDLVPSNSSSEVNMTLVDDGGAATNATVEVLDTVTTESCAETSALVRYIVSGCGNCTVRNLRSGSATEMPVSFQKGIDSPFPLMNSKAAVLESSTENNAMGIVRAVKYILTTVVQFRVLEGYGSGLDSAPGGTSDIIAPSDVELAVNLAVILETVRLFRDYDESILLGQDGEGFCGSTLNSLIQDYLGNSTLDPADIVALYSGLGEENMPADIILAQAFNAIIDQFILKYLDYFGITDIANGIYRTGQVLHQWVEDIGRSLSGFIWGDDGENRKDIAQVTNWLSKNSADIPWPPTNVTRPGLVAGKGPASPTDLAVLDMNQPVSSVFQYSGQCGQLIGEYSEPLLDLDGAVIGERRHATVQMHNLTANTIPSASSPHPEGYRADFTPVSLIRQTPEMLALWTEFYNQFYAGQEDVIYNTIRDAVKNITYELSGLITSFMGQTELSLSEYAGGIYAVNPLDRTSTLQGLRDMISDAITSATEHLMQNPGNINALLSVLTNRQSKLTLRLIEYVSQNYDTIVGMESCKQAGLETLALSMLLNSTVSVQNANAISADYLVYNELGLSRGYSDSPRPYNCTTAPDAKICAIVLREQCRGNISTDLQAFADAAYTTLKQAESAWVYSGNLQNGLYIQALEEKMASLTGSILTRFIGSDPSSLVCLARDMVIGVMDSIIWSGEVSNTQYAPELIYSDTAGGFEMYEGERDSAFVNGAVSEERFTVSQPEGWLEAAQPGTAPAPGCICVNISEPAGIHYTNAVTFNERPFENRWNVSISGNFTVRAQSSSCCYAGNGTYSPVILEKIFQLDIAVPILAYSGWDLVGVNYTCTASLAGDIEKLMDIVSAFFDWVWGTIVAPINWVIDQVMKVVDFFADLVGKLLAYAQDIMNKVTEMLGFLVERVQEFITEIADKILNSIVDWIIDLLPDGSEFRFSAFGFDFLLSFATDEEMDSIEAGYGGKLFSARTEGKLLGTGFDVGLELWSLSDNVSADAEMEYDILLDADIDMFGFGLEIDVDPFMLLQEHIVEIDGQGAGWQTAVDAPVVENVYDSVQYSLHDIAGVGAALSNIPIPFLGMKASVNAGLEIKYTLRGLEEDNLVINEVELNPRGLDYGTQWVELYNPLDQNISLGNWTLSYGNTTAQNITFNETFVMEPFGYWIVQFNNTTVPTESVRLELIDPGGVVIDRTPILSEPDNDFINNISTGSSGCGATWQRNPNGANLTLAGKWNFTQGSIGAENAAIDIELKPLVWALLKNAFNTTWQDLKDELALSLDFIVKLVTQFIQRFIEDVLRVVERSVVETILFLDVMFTDMTGSGGGGITLSFVIEGGDTLAVILRWIIGSVAAFLSKVGKPSQPSQYPKLAENVPEHLFVRLEFYGLVQMPQMLKKAAGTEEDMAPIKLAGRIEANIPALAALVGKEMGRWRINFGVFIEKVPPKIADPLFNTGNKTVNVWLFRGSVWEC